MGTTINRDQIPALIYQRYGPEGGERVLLVGPPGTGKTALAIAHAQRQPGTSPMPPVAASCEWGKEATRQCSKPAAIGQRYCSGHMGVLRQLGREPKPREGLEMTFASLRTDAPDAPPRPWQQVTLTSETLEPRIWAGLYPSKLTAGMEEVRGPGALMWELGGLWIVNELHRGSADCHERIINALDDAEFASDSTAYGTVYRQHPRFGCIATQNAPSTVLSDALRDRFQLRIAVLRPPEGAMAKLDPDVRKYTERAYASLTQEQWEEGPRPSYRDCLSFTLARRAGIPDEIAARLIVDDSEMAPAAFLENLKTLAGEDERYAASTDQVEVEA